MKTCSVKSCQRKVKAKNLCDLHYQRLKRLGKLTINNVPRGSTHSHYLRATYTNMMSRCSNPKSPRFKDYGGRGIRVCDRWNGQNGFIYFVEDMGNRPENMTLDRIDVNGEYSPQNCRWADAYVQSSNTRKPHLYPGVTYFSLRSKWRARIKIKTIEHHLGLFNTIEEAVIARKQAERELSHSF